VFFYKVKDLSSFNQKGLEIQLISLYSNKNGIPLFSKSLINKLKKAVLKGCRLVPLLHLKVPKSTVF